MLFPLMIEAAGNISPNLQLNYKLELVSVKLTHYNSVLNVWLETQKWFGVILWLALAIY